jgi:hypothetical protein
MVVIEAAFYFLYFEILPQLISILASLKRSCIKASENAEKNVSTLFHSHVSPHICAARSD